MATAVDEHVKHGKQQVPAGGVPQPPAKPRRHPDDEIAAALCKAEWVSEFDKLVDSSLTEKQFGVSHINRRHRRTKVAQSADELKLALHAKKVGGLKLQVVRERLNDAERMRMDQLLTMTCVSVGGRHRMKAPVGDAKELEAAGYCEWFDVNGKCKFSAVDYFSVVEAAKNRRRPIFWPRELLKTSRYASEFSLHSVHDYRRSVHDGSHACAFDLAASFAQVDLPSTANLVFLDENNQGWRLRRLPYGIDVAPEIMQIIVDGLAQAAKRESKTNVHIYVHIDNVMAIGSEEAVHRWRAVFLEMCKAAAVTLNDEPTNTVKTSTSFAGLELDFANKTVSLRQQFIDRLAPITEATTNQDLESTISRFIYGWAATGRDWFDVYFAIKWFRRRLSALSRNVVKWQDAADPPPCVFAALNGAIHKLRINEPSMVRAREDASASRGILATDACLKGWGAVLLRPGHMPLAIGGVFREEPPNIGQAETVAVIGGVTRFADELAELGAFTLLIDNTSSQHMIAKAERGDMPSGQASTGDLALQVVQLVRSIGSTMYVARISTGDNIADEVSRGQPIDLSKIEACVKASLQWSSLLADGSNRRRGDGARTRRSPNYPSAKQT
ncbi:MAG: hypothetical protein Q9Q40_03645 [Acidobacteriota bacterium]|nr:hypothetical protein [Acidobacteriota bacterium]